MSVPRQLQVTNNRKITGQKEKPRNKHLIAQTGHSLLRSSPPLSCAPPAAPLPPFRARFRVTLLCTSGGAGGSVTREYSSSVASFRKARQLLRRTQSTSR